MLAAEGHLAFWETYRLSEIWRSLSVPFRDGEIRNQFIAMFDSTSFKSSYTADQSCLFGYVFENQKNNLTRITDSLRTAQALPPDVRFAFLGAPVEEHPGTTGVILLKTKSDGTARLDNPQLTEVKTIPNKYDKNLEISMRMDSAATMKWAVMTRENTGRSIAIVLDGAVLLYPNVNGEITGGVSSITGNFDKAETERIVTLLKTGPLPCPVKMIEINNGKQ
jgi:SecD/SecF fusion protein